VADAGGRTFFSHAIRACDTIANLYRKDAAPMTSLGTMLKGEITRLSRKEARVQVEPLRKANAAYRRDIAELKRQVVLLQRQLTGLGRVRKQAAEQPTEAKPTRFVAKGLRSLRARLGVSAAEFGQLVGASGQSVYNWESGKAVPRAAQMAALAEVRGLGKREAQARLAEVGTRASKKK
jgi:DNA-binding transcriptional regulator YiaG